MKARRQSAILELVSGQPVRSQNVLRRLLAGLDIRATQATISRDVKELGLVKRAADGAYQLVQAAAGTPAIPDERVRRAVTEYLRRVEQVQQLLVLKTDPGQARWRSRSTMPPGLRSSARLRATTRFSSSCAPNGVRRPWAAGWSGGRLDRGLHRRTAPTPAEAPIPWRVGRAASGAAGDAFRARSLRRRSFASAKLPTRPQGRAGVGAAGADSWRVGSGGNRRRSRRSPGEGDGGGPTSPAAEPEG